MIKRNVLVLACAFGALIQTNAFAADAMCTQKALKGSYNYHLTGQEAGKTFAAAGIETFDGKGVGAAKEVDSDGEIRNITSTYVVNSDCSGEITYSNGDHNHIFVAPDGSGFSFVSDDETHTGNWYTGNETRISKGQVALIP